jgi:hypothetical protein
MSFSAITVGGTAISTWTRHARLLKYGSGAKRGTNYQIAGRQAEHSATMKWHTPTDVLLEVALLRSPTVLANLSGLLAKLDGASGLVTVGATSTFHGGVQAKVELLAEPYPVSEDPSVYVFTLHNPAGVWEDATPSNAAAATPPVVVTSGDRPIDDMVLTFSGPGYLEHTNGASEVARITIDAGAGAGTYIVDCGARTVQKAAADQDAYLTLTQDYWMRFDAGGAQALTSDVNVEVDWRDKWAI